MNIPDSKVEQELKKALSWLPLTEKNQELFQEYILLEQRDDAILAAVEPQTNFRASSHALYFYVPMIRMEDMTNKPIMDRMLEFLWAAGGTGVASLLNRGRGFMSESDTPTWREKVLGTVPAAVLSAASAFVSTYYINDTVRWLLTADANCLREAQSLCGYGENHAFALIAAALDRRENDAEQREKLLDRLLDALSRILFGLPSGDIEAARSYIRAGDPGAPVPVLPSLQNPAVDASSAQFASWSEIHLLRTYAMSALLTAEHDSRMKCALRFFTLLYPSRIFYDAVEYLPKEEIVDILTLLERELPGGGVTMTLFAVRHGFSYKSCREELRKRCKPYFMQAMQCAEPEQYLQLLPYMEEELRVEELQAKLALGLSKCVYAQDEQDAYVWLMDTSDLSDAAEQLKIIRPGFYRNLHRCMKLLREYVLKNSLDNFALRCVAFAGLVFENPHMFDLIWTEHGNTDAHLLNHVIKQLCEKGLPVGEVLGILDRQNEHGYWDDHKASIRGAALALSAPEFVPEFARVLPTGSVFVRSVALELLDGQSGEPGAKEAILSAAGDSSKQVREQMARILPNHPEWTEDYKAMLTAKKAAVRILAAEALGKLGQKDALEAALAKEKNTKAADAIRAALGAEAAAPVGSGADLAAQLVKGNKLKKLSWLLDQPLQTLRNADGTEADENIRNAILLSYCELGRIGRSDTAAGLFRELDAGDLQKLAVQVFDLWFAAGAQAKNKWVLPFAAVYGGAAMTQRLSKAIRDWPEHQRGAIACDAVMALALSSDPAAIVIVDSISRKFKFRQVKTAAAAALENAAQELGISAEDLADRIVPDLGFSKDGTRVFDYGKRSFTVRLLPTLELAITNDQGKAVKNLPAPGKTDDPIAAGVYEDFKAMKKAIKTTATAQRARLEAALSGLRCWDTERWKALFVDNPIMHQFAMSLIWGIYENGALTDTFRYMEDGSFNTVDEEEFTLPDQAQIGLVHPVELDDGTVQDWKQQLQDYEIRQAIDQLDRTVYRLDPQNAAAKALEDFGGKRINTLALSGKLLGLGWYRGSVQDGGFFTTFYREDKALGIGAELRFSGAAVGYDDGEPVTVYDAVFYTGTIRRGSYIYDTIPEEQIVALGDVPARYYSEIMLHLNKATASSTETDENWRNGR